ncbi:hypothetical protein WJX84_006287 [Apatococcus fuscideae]|uniref:Uncharacterized protein n=1 Tax=Apatococcus fuscideae TaxID=2026836 RepID=A0AAW1TIP7_9CHLO
MPQLTRTLDTFFTTASAIPTVPEIFEDQAEIIKPLSPACQPQKNYGPNRQLVRKAAPDPLLLLHTMRQQAATKWNPGDERLIASAAVTDGTVRIYNLETTLSVRSPALTLKLATEREFLLSSNLWRDQVSPRGASRGRVVLWDLRAPNGPQCWLAADRLTAATGHVQSLEATRDGKCLIAGCRSGEVLVWDLRGGSGAGLRFGGSGPVRHPLLQATNLGLACSKVPGLTVHAGAPPSRLHTLCLDPADDHRCAFQLACGWAGVLDLVSQRVTHFHCSSSPLSQFMEDMRRRPPPSGWDQSEPQLFSNRGMPLDLRGLAMEGPATCQSSEALGRDYQTWAEGAHQHSCAVQLPITCPALSVAVHPQSDEVVIGTAARKFSVCATAQSAG